MSTARRTSQTITAPSNNTNSRRRSSTNSTYSTDSVDLVFDNINVGASKTPANKSIIEHPLSNSNTTPLIHNNIQTHISPNRISPKYHPASTAKKKSANSNSNNNNNNNNSSPPRSRRKSSRRGSNNSTTSSKLSASQQQQANNKKKLLLPRSIRWRISLNLLNTPVSSSDTDDDIPSSSSSTTNNNNNKQEEKEKLYKSIEEINALKIRCQRSHYDELEKLHYWKSTPAAIASSDNNDDTADHYSVGKASVAGGKERQQTNDLHHRHVSLGDDPLSSLLQRKKSNEYNNTTTTENDKPKEKWGGIFGNKNRDRTTKSKDNLQQRVTAELERTTQSNKQSEVNKTNESACKGSRWAEYYSTREVLDVIEKDLDRLPNDHYVVFHEYRMKKFDVNDNDDGDRHDDDERVDESKRAAKRTCK